MDFYLVTKKNEEIYIYQIGMYVHQNIKRIKAYYRKLYSMTLFC